MIDAPGWNNSQTIDWAKAPEWAGAVVEGLSGTKFWVKKFGGVSVRQRLGASEPDLEVAKMCGKHGWTLVETRPTETPAWNGEGLPPVGTVCEVRSEGGWYVVRILAVDSDGFSVYESPWLNIPYDGEDDPHQFRPARTPEQVAAETRESTVDEMVDVWRRTMGRFALEERGLAEMLYDAGYRKVEQP